MGRGRDQRGDEIQRHGQSQLSQFLTELPDGEVVVGTNSQSRHESRK